MIEEEPPSPAAPNGNPDLSEEHPRISIREVGVLRQMTKQETFRYLKKLFSATFGGGGHRVKEEMENIRGILYTRAWIIASIFLSFRVLVVISGNADW